MHIDLDALAIPDALRSFAEQVQDAPDALSQIAIRLLEAVDIPARDRAICALALRAHAPLERLVWAATDDIVYTGIPFWHWSMVADAERNTAYRTAIEACVEPGMTVLEIGAGTGLLAMMAARAGAGHVYTIEANPMLAQVARLCIDRNGFGDRVTLIEGHSKQVEIGTALPRRCDMLIHELLTTTVVTEQMIPSIAHARAELLEPGAPMLPDRVIAKGVVSGLPGSTEGVSTPVEGFDLTPLNLLSAQTHSMSLPLGRFRLSDVQDLLDLDLEKVTDALTGRNTLTFPITRGGDAAGVEQWFEAHFPDGTKLNTDSDTSHWRTVFHPFGVYKPVSPGMTVATHIDFRAEHLAVSAVVSGTPT